MSERTSEWSSTCEPILGLSRSLSRPLHLFSFPIPALLTFSDSQVSIMRLPHRSRNSSLFSFSFCLSFFYIQLMIISLSLSFRWEKPQLNGLSLSRKRGIRCRIWFSVRSTSQEIQGVFHKCEEQMEEKWRWHSRELKNGCIYFNNIVVFCCCCCWYGPYCPLHSRQSR